MKKSELYAQLQSDISEEIVADTPIYLRLANAMERLFDRGIIPEGEAIPSERQLADQLGLARGTVRQAIEQLVEIGRLTRRHGARSIVSKRLEKSLSNLVGFSEDMRARGIEPGAILLSCEASLPNVLEAKALQLPPGAKILRLKRIRTANQKPIAIECAAVPAELLDEASLANGSLYEALRNVDAEPVRGFQRIRAGIADADISRHLGCEIGSALLIIERVCEDKSGFPVEFTETRYTGENYDFLTELVK